MAFYLTSRTLRPSHMLERPAEDPDFTTDTGSEWWLDKAATDYAKKGEQFRPGEPPMEIWLVRAPEKGGYWLYVATVARRNVFTAETAEQLQVNIDNSFHI